MSNDRTPNEVQFTTEQVGTHEIDAINGTDVFVPQEPQLVAWITVDGESVEHQPVVLKSAYDALRAKLAAAETDRQAWEKLYRRAVNEANGLTNYVEERPELRRAEKNLDAIEREAQALRATPTAPTVGPITVLPDGHAFTTVSFPLPADHWLTQPGDNVPPMPWRVGVGEVRTHLAEAIRGAARYAIRATTNNGAEDDYDPDAMVQNFVVGLLGYWTEDGTSAEPMFNPSPLPAGMSPVAPRARVLDHSEAEALSPSRFVLLNKDGRVVAPVFGPEEEVTVPYWDRIQPHNAPHRVGTLAVIDSAAAPTLPLPPQWKPIASAPRDNTRLLALAQFGEDGELVALGWDGVWESQRESWEIPEVYYFWATALGSPEEPTHWAYQDEPLPPLTALAPNTEATTDG